MWQKETTSEAGTVGVRQLNGKENGRCFEELPNYRSNAGGDWKTAIILPGAPHQSLGRAAASAVNSRRLVDCAPWAQRGKRNCRDRTERGISTPRFRCAIFKLSKAVGGSGKNSRLS